MLPTIKSNATEEEISNFQSIRNIENRTQSIGDNESNYTFGENASTISNMKLRPVLKQTKFTENQKSDIKFHFECSDAMRQTQYNKLINVVNKFDTQRIRKAIREGKINNLINSERNNPVILKSINNTKASVTENQNSEKSSTRIHNVESARRRRKEYYSKGKMEAKGQSLERIKSFISKTNTTYNTLDAKRQTIDNTVDSLTPLEMKMIREQILTDSHKSTADLSLRNQRLLSSRISVQKSNVDSSDKLSYLSRLQIDNNSKTYRLSPRLEEFVTIQKDQISKILNDSESKKNEISEYPERTKMRIIEKSFENVSQPNRKSDPINLIENSSTYHFKVNLNKGMIAMK